MTYLIVAPTSPFHPPHWAPGFWGFLSLDGGHQGDGFRSEAHVRSFLTGRGPIIVEA